MDDKIIITDCVPLPMEQIRNLYANKDKVFFLLDYEQSSIKDQGFLFYVSNLEIPGDVLLNTSSDQKLNLIKEYMNLPTLLDMNSLNVAVMQIILARKQVDTTGMFDVPALTDEEIHTFLVDNEPLVNNWIIFLDSMYVYGLYTAYMPQTIGDATDDSIIAERIKNNPIRSMVPELMDPTYISPNFVYLIQTPTFFESYFSNGINLDETYFFTYQFTEYCYKGLNLYHYFTQNENWLLAAIITLLGGATDPDTITDSPDLQTDDQPSSN